MGALDHHQISTAASAQILSDVTKMIPRNPETNEVKSYLFEIFVGRHLTHSILFYCYGQRLK